MKTVGKLIVVLIALTVASSAFVQTKSVPQAIQSCRADLDKWVEQSNNEDDKLGYGALEDRSARLEYCYSIDKEYSVDPGWPDYVRKRASLYMTARDADDKAQAIRDRDFIKRHDLGGKLRQEDAAGER
jgi:hypothetical protein